MKVHNYFQCVFREPIFVDIEFPSVCVLFLFIYLISAFCMKQIMNLSFYVAKDSPDFVVIYCSIFSCYNEEGLK